MNKKDLLKTINEIVENDDSYDLESDSGTEQLFNDLENKIGLEFSIVAINRDCDGWLECQYYSKAIGKNIIWDVEVGNFDDYEEVVGYIINTTKEIKDFESRLILKSNE